MTFLDKESQESSESNKCEGDAESQPNSQNEAGRELRKRLRVRQVKKAEEGSDEDYDVR